MFEDFNLNGKDKKFLILILIFSTILIGYYINFNISIGTYCSDVFLYLLNGLYFTGQHIHYPENIYLSPVVCFLTSILFRFGLVDKVAIFIVTGFLAILGNVGLYVLLRRYFSEILSLSGVVIYSGFTLGLTWLANGSLDVPAVTMTIWIALVGLIAIKDNPKYYRYLFLLFALGFYTRYTTMLVLPALIMYYVHVNGFKIKSEDRKEIIIGVVLGVILFGIITFTIYSMSNGNFLLTGQFSDRVAGTEGGKLDPAYNPDPSYYLVNMPNFISNSHTVLRGNPDLENPTILSYLIVGILTIASLIWLKDNTQINVKKQILPLILFVLAALSFKNVSSMITIILTLSGLYLLGKDSDNKVAYFMLGWILSNFIFYSAFDIKVNRYILPIFPPFTYFVVRAIDILNEKIRINENIIPIILIALFVIQAFAFTATFEPTDQFTALEDISDYIAEHDADYKNVKIGAYNMRPYLWYLGYNVTGIESSNPQAIDSSNVTYYISDVELGNLENYHEIKVIDRLHLYQLNS